MIPRLGGRFRLNSSKRLFISSLAFASGWMSLSFTFPLLARNLGFSYSVIGLIGMSGAVPFIAVSYLFRHSTTRVLRIGTALSLTALVSLSIAMVFGYERYFLPIALLASLFQAPWWISNEIALGGMEGSNNAEKYSIGWGLPNAAAPLVMGAVIGAFGFRYVFFFAAAAFTLSIYFTQKLNVVLEQRQHGRTELKYVTSLFFSGLFSGFEYYVLEPLMRSLGYAYYLIGFIVGIYGVMVAIGFIVLNYSKELEPWHYSVISASLVFPTIILAFENSALIIIGVSLASGLGVSVSMSKILSYIAKTSDTRTGVYYYESMFGLGFIIGSLGEGTLLQIMGNFTIFFLFLWSGVYAAAIIIYVKLRSLAVTPSRP